MKRLKNLCATLALVLVFANATLAGDGVIYPWIIPPPPPSTPATQGTIHTGLTSTSEEPASDLATEIAMSLFQSMLTLF